MAFFGVQALAPSENEYFKIEYWPQPFKSADRKTTLTRSMFYTRSSTSQVATQLKLPIKLSIIGLRIASNNYIISASDSHYLKSETDEQSAEQTAFNKFLAKSDADLGFKEYYDSPTI